MPVRTAVDISCESSSLRVEVFETIFCNNFKWIALMQSMLDEEFRKRHSIFLPRKQADCLLCQSLFSGKNMKTIINFLSAEFAQRKVKVNVQGIF